MKRIWPVLAVLLLTACGIQPSGVTGGGEAPTGVTRGVTLYFIDAHGDLTPRLRRTDHLGTIPEAMELLLWGPGESSLRTEIAPVTPKRVVVTSTAGVILLRVPFTAQDVTPLGIDQIVCTALAVHVQGGGPRGMKVRIGFTQDTPESGKQRTCPLIK
ncbi:hypothetical protein E1293_34910 [Actinomadura darangshiensis]|uniref:GerMN domain-containing protein n=1 Tax=Actinomadura darangshiensis TaxID=705336 RepID=A0A4R5AFY4_9ACTN|nr:hypothetical protein [Actinomadura darangshiensis]TDD70320.1 hypothetical protein E1293_34910 [Actinomadura darangshiensis]